MTVMFDSIDPDQLPSGAGYAYAGYVSGRWPDYATIKAKFPAAHVLSIAIDASHDADCLDIETGDATPSQAVAWYERQRQRGIARPCLYASASVMQERVVPMLLAASVSPQAVRLWSAHYTGSAHICGPGSCREMSIEADGTQWTSHALGRDLDESLLAADFFGSAPPVPPVPSWQEAMMQALPVVQQGDTGQPVRTVQALCVARGHATTVDGAFGNATKLSVEAVQRSHGLTVDGAVGAKTWPALMGV